MVCSPVATVCKHLEGWSRGHTSLSTALVARECKAHSVTCKLWSMCQSVSPIKARAVSGQPLSYLFVSLCSAKQQLPQHHPDQTSLASLERYDFFPAFTGDINESCSCLLIKTRPICIQTGMGGGLTDHPDRARAGGEPGRWAAAGRRQRRQ